MTKTKSEEVEALNSEREYLRGFRDGQELEKERVRKEVGKLRESQVEHKDKCPKTFNIRKRCDCGARINQRINQALDTLLDNLK